MANCYHKSNTFEKNYLVQYGRALACQRQSGTSRIAQNSNLHPLFYLPPLVLAETYSTEKANSAFPGIPPITPT